MKDRTGYSFVDHYLIIENDSTAEGLGSDSVKIYTMINMFLIPLAAQMNMKSSYFYMPWALGHCVKATSLAKEPH